jgi:hypothetical protein
MMSKTYFGLALCACALSSAHALFGTLSVGAAGTGTAITATALGAATGSTVFLTATGATVLGGAILLKGLALAGLVASQAGRVKRSAQTATSDDFAFAALAQSEPAQCYRRLICDLATGAMPKSENDVIVTLFNKPSAIDSPKFDFATAASIGKQVKSVQLCELRYSCPLSTSDIQKLFN